MKKGFILILAIIVLFGPVSCGKSELALDCSSPRSFAESAGKMLEQLNKDGSHEELQNFTSGMFKITMEFNQSGEDMEVLAQYDGWTTEDVINYGG